jgi:hypothetical protein
MGLGRTADAAGHFADTQGHSVDTPASTSYWFERFLYPIWRDYGRSIPLARYFQLTRQYFPKQLGYYSRTINTGEFIHFMSRAACANVMPLAKAAFVPWNAAWDAEYAKAQLDFAGMGRCEEETVNLGALNTDTQLVVNGEKMLDVTALPVGWTPTSINIAVTSVDNQSLSGVRLEQGGTITALSGYYQSVAVPFVQQERIRAFIRADSSRTLKLKWWAN